MVIRTLLALGAMLLMFAPLTAEQASSVLPQRFTAFAVGLGGPRTAPVATQIEIELVRWSTADETRELFGVLKGGGPEPLLEALRKTKPVGTIRTPGNLAYDLHYAQYEAMGDGIERIVIATDRPISMWEAVNRPRSIDYPFTFIELRMRPDGTGEGKLASATTIDLTRDGKTLQLVNYDTQPVNLNEVRRQRR